MILCKLVTVMILWMIKVHGSLGVIDSTVLLGLLPIVYLSLGVIVGIVVGVLVVVMITLLVILIIMWCRHQAPPDTPV